MDPAKFSFVLLLCWHTYIFVYLLFGMEVYVMARSRVTSKFQLTIPKEVRDKVGLKPGEVVIVESIDENNILIRRIRRVKDPLRFLIGEKPYPRHIPIEELEEKAEAR